MCIRDIRKTATNPAAVNLLSAAWVVLIQLLLDDVPLIDARGGGRARGEARDIPTRRRRLPPPPRRRRHHYHDHDHAYAYACVWE